MSELDKRRAISKYNFIELQKALTESKKLIKNKACIYATGSYGRREASQYSDLDLFIVGLNQRKKNSRGGYNNQLSELDATCAKAQLIYAVNAMGLPKFDGDGKFLKNFSLLDITKTLGTPEDDATNTFTARLLLLLESDPLIGGDVYLRIIDKVIDAYWRDYDDHKKDFVPAYLANDILRLWRTFCVNYEARTQREPDNKKAEGKLKNYKLKHGRIITCFSALLYLLTIYRRTETVTPESVREMVKLTPTERLQWLLGQDDLSAAHFHVRNLLEKYDEFLINTNYSEAEMINKFRDKGISDKYMKDANKFGDIMFGAINAIGDGSRFHRLIVV